MLRDPRLVLVLAVAVGLWVPFARADWLVTNEGASYVWRTIEWATELRAGELYPRWCLKALFDSEQVGFKIGRLLVSSAIAVVLGLLINFRMGRRALGWTFLTALLRQRRTSGRAGSGNLVASPWRRSSNSPGDCLDRPRSPPR